MPRLKSILFYQNSPKIKLFLKKMQNFQALEAKPPDPRAFGGWGFALTLPDFNRCSPNTAPSLRISGYAPGNFLLFIRIFFFVAFFKQFFLNRSVATS